jgi:Tol biopolymer transport system component
MIDDPDDPALLALGAALSDGVPIDWQDEQRRAEGDEQQRLLQGLRDLAPLLEAHRSAASVDAPAAPAQPAPRLWRHLLLFEPIGAGAFGTVYRGWDPQLEREVAVKIFPKATVGTSSPLAEARNLARVRHAGIVDVYGADQTDTEVGIWMEYIEGQTLADMVREHGPMSAREVIGIGIDLCGALSALHGAGLIHRDIKAQNVMREVGGRIVLMDFSGAQALAPSGEPSAISGTPLFMAPELLRGAAATVVSDVYSLGILLFFLLTGTVPLDRTTVADLRQAHQRGLRKRLRDLRPDLPEPVVQVVERAALPDPAARYQTPGELEHALATASGSRAVLLRAGDVVDRTRAPHRGWWHGQTAFRIAAVFLFGFLAAFVLLRFRPAPPPGMTARFTVGPPYVSGSWPRLSPDGRLVIFGTTVEGRSRLWVREMDSLEGHALMNTTANETPFWSPDSRSVAFFEDGRLKRISVEGDGASETLAEAPRPRGGDWGSAGLLFASAKGIFRVAPDGSQLTAVTTVDPAQGEFEHGWPRFLPDGQRFLYVIRSTRPERAGVYLGTLDGSQPVRLMAAYSRVTYANGQLLFVRDGTLLAQPFDPGTVRLSGSPVALAGRVKSHAEGDAAFDVASGVLIYSLEPGQSITRLMLFDRRGRELQAIAPSGAYRHPSFSPDGQRLAAERADPDDNNTDLWIYGIARRSATRLTSTPEPDVRPVWSADGLRIIFSSKRDTVYGIFSKMVDGTAPATPLVPSTADTLLEHASADGRYLTASIRASGLWVIPLAPGERPWAVQTDARANGWESEFSPDGRWLAYMSEESGTPEVYIEPFPATGMRWQVSTGGGAEPHWRGDGRELFYVANDATLTAVDAASADWANAKATPLFRISIPDLTGNDDYDVAPDGQTFVVNVFLADPLVPPIDVVVNWLPLIDRR